MADAARLAVLFLSQGRYHHKYTFSVRELQLDGSFPNPRRPTMAIKRVTPSIRSTVASTSLPRIELRAIERFFTMKDSASFKIAQVVHVKGQVEEFLRHAPKALVQTFNRHPKMRAKQVKNEFAVAEIHPHITLEDIAKLGLLQVKETDMEGMTAEHWHQYAQEQADIPFDRYNQFPFSLHVWVDKANDQARLFLFSDHYLSDGSSGNTVLNDVLTFASSLSTDPNSAASSAPEELPVRASLYDLTLEAHPYLSPALQGLMKVIGRPLLKLMPPIVPVITPLPDQKDFSIPPPSNSSTMLFADGTKENLDKLLMRCKEEDTTFFGALTASILTGYAANTVGANEKKPLKLSMFANFNMRERFSTPIERDAVGYYASASPLLKLSRSRIDVHTRRFWDLARAAKHEANDSIQSFAGQALPIILYDQRFSSRSDSRFFDGIPCPGAIVGDTNISSPGRYPYKMSHSFTAPGATRKTSEMSMESVHFNLRTPFIVPATQFTVTSVRGVCYGVSHHYDEAVGKTLFDMVVTVMEHSGSIRSDDTLTEVIRQVAKA